MDDFETIEKRIVAIEERNKRVEREKAWEGSLLRKSVILTLTYGVIVLFMYAAHIVSPWLNAIVPSVGFLLSTLSMPYIKKWWIKNTYE